MNPLADRYTTPLKLKVGDRVRLVGEEWSVTERGSIVTVDELRNAGEQAWNTTVHGINSLTSYDGRMIRDFEIELIQETEPEHLIEPTTSQLNAFLTAWVAADNLGLIDQRTRAGLIAVLNLKEQS